MNTASMLALVNVLLCSGLGWVFSSPSLEVIHYFSRWQSHPSTTSQKQFMRLHKPMEVSPELVCNFCLTRGGGNQPSLRRQESG